MCPVFWLWLILQQDFVVSQPRYRTGSGISPRNIPKRFNISFVGCFQWKNQSVSNHPLVCCDHAAMKGLVGMQGRGSRSMWWWGQGFEVWRLPPLSSVFTFSCFRKYTLISLLPTWYHKKKDRQLTLAQIMNFLFPNSDLNWKKWGKPLDYSVQFSPVQSLSHVQLFASMT